VVEETGGQYGEEGYLIQEYFELPAFDTYPGTDFNTKVHPVLGAWVIDGDPAGMGIRESESSDRCPGRITKNGSFFAPHRIATGERRLALQTAPAPANGPTHPQS
jgi:glutathionylspermidine synthase